MIMKYRKMFYIMPALIAAVGLLSLLGSRATSPDGTFTPAVSYSETRVAERAYTITVRGTVESVERRNVYTTLGYKIRRVYVEVGDPVTEGLTLGVLDTDDLMLAIAQQRADLEMARQSSQNAVQDSLRLFNEAYSNLANNTNVQILSAEAALEAAVINLTEAKINHNNALIDYRERTDAQILNAETALKNARIELEARRITNENLRALHYASALSREDLRQSENALAYAQNTYDNARMSRANAITSLRRSLEQLEISLQSATNSQRQAQEMLYATRVAAKQDIERLRSNVEDARISANLEPREIALQILEKRLEDSTITAPINGVVTAVLAREGAIGSGLLFVIEDTDNLRIKTRFREYDIGRVRTGMDVTISSDATGSAVYTGRVSRIYPAAIKNASGETASTPILEFEAEVAVTSVNTDLRIGMNVRLDISVKY